MKKFVGVSMLMAVLLPSIALVAHHAFAAEFDLQTVGTIRGVVTRVRWVKPHPYILLDVRNDRGTVEPWYIEGSNTRILEQAGWSATTLKAGETISTCGYLNRPDVSLSLPTGVVATRAQVGITVTLADSRQLPFQAVGRDCSPNR